MKEDFNEYMTFFKGQPLKEKQSIILEQLKMLAGLTNTMCKELNVDNEILLSKELVELNSDGYSEEDFAEALIIYINSIQNSLCDFSDKLSDIVSNI